MEYIKKIREFLKDPKKRALTQLGLWAIFFVFVFTLLNSGETTNIDIPVIEDPKTPLEVYKDMKGYTYKVTYTNLDKTDIIEGTYYNNMSLFTYNTLKYYYDSSLYVIDNDSYYLTNIEYDITKIFNNNLKKIVDKLEEQSKTTYKDGTITTNYIVLSNDIYNYLYGVENTYTNYVNVNITEKENKITNITIDLSGIDLNLKKIEIEYSNIDNIAGLEFNKENYTYKESL